MDKFVLSLSYYVKICFNRLFFMKIQIVNVEIMKSSWKEKDKKWQNVGELSNNQNGAR